MSDENTTPDGEAQEQTDTVHVIRGVIKAETGDEAQAGSSDDESGDEDTGDESATESE